MKNKRLILISFIILCITFTLCFLISQNSDISNKYNPETSDRYQAILSIENNEMMIAPAGYDKDSHVLFEKEIETLKLSENVECFNLSVNSKINKEGKKTSKEEYSKLTLNEIKNMLNDCFLTGYLWLDNNEQISVIMLYGETIIYE